MHTRLGRVIVLGLLAYAPRAAAELIPTLKLAAEERYDDDPLLRGKCQNCLITKLSPQIGLDINEHRFTAHSYYAADIYTHSASSYSGVEVDHRGLIDFKNLLSNVFSLEGRVEVWRVSDPTSLPRLGLATTLSPILYGAAQLAGAERLSARTTLRVGYRFEGAKIYEPDPFNRAVQRAPGFAHVPFAELWYRLTPRTDVGAEYRYQYLNFDPLISQGNTISALYRYRISPETKLTLRAGPTYYQKLDDNPLDLSTTGWMPRLVLEMSHSARGSEIGFMLGHELAGAYGLTSGLWVEYATLFGSQRLSKDFSFFGNATAYRSGLAANRDLGTFRSTFRTAEGYWVNAGLEWRLMKDVALNGIFTRIQQVAGSTGVPAADLTRNIFAIRLVYTAL